MDGGDRSKTSCTTLWELFGGSRLRATPAELDSLGGCWGGIEANAGRFKGWHGAAAGNDDDHIGKRLIEALAWSGN